MSTLPESFFFGILVLACLTTAFLLYQFVKARVLYNHKRLAVIAKSFYNYYYSIKGITHLRVNNYGYAPVDDEITTYEPELQYGIQLYKEVVKNHRGYMISDKSSVVEVGCGKGAGAEYLLRKFNPREYSGLDYSKNAINYCLTTYAYPNHVKFIFGDAHELPFQTESADVVLNVESSHIYKDVDKFFKEVHRILKHKGYFLFADYRYVKNVPIDELEMKIAECGFVVIDRRIITKQIHHACILASELRRNVISKASPWFLKRYFSHYAAIKGTKKLQHFGNGEIEYFIYHLEKQR